MNKFIERAFDQASAGYDRPAMRFFDSSAESLVRGLPLRGDEKVLDAATGTGKIAVALAERLKNGHVTGVDLSGGMLDAARNKVNAKGLKNVTFIQSDIDLLDQSPGYFDGMTCGFGVHFWPKMESSFARAVSLVRKGGFVAITSFAEGSFEPQSSACVNRFKKFGVKLPRTYNLIRLNDLAKNKTLFENTGLKNISCTTNQFGFYLKDASEWWDLVLFTGFRAFLDELNAEKAAHFKEEHLREIEAMRVDQGIRLNVEVITATGTV